MFFDIIDHGVHPSHLGHPDARRSAAGGQWRVFEAGRGDVEEAAQAIGQDSTVGIEVLRRPGVHLRLAGPAEAAQAQGNWMTLRIGRYCGDERYLVGRAPTGLAPAALTALIDIVELEDTRALAPGVAFHHPLQPLVLDAPGDSIRLRGGV